MGVGGGLKFIPISLVVQGTTGSILSNKYGQNVTVVRTNVGRYTLTVPAGFSTGVASGADILHPQMNTVDDLARDSVEIHPINITATSFNIQIHSGDNGAAANVYVDRDFIVHIPQ